MRDATGWRGSSGCLLRPMFLIANIRAITTAGKLDKIEYGAGSFAVGP
jgi:hypothetical protein